MKTLSPTELIELLKPDAASLDQALRAFDAAAPVLCREPGYVKRLVDEGFMEASEVHWQGRPAFLVTWHVTNDRGFWLDVAQTLNGGAPFAVLIEATERLAREHGCRYVRFLTLRRGLVKLTAAHAYHAEAVMLTKVL